MIHDVTVPITNTMRVWPSDPPVRLTSQTHLTGDNSHSVRLTSIEMGSHTGTHIDAPWHFVANGIRLNEIPIETLVGPVTVVEVPNVPSIGPAEVERLRLDGIERILFKTENSKHWTDDAFYEHFVYLEPEAAELLVLRGMKLVGIDYLSIDRLKSEKHPTHFVLLQHNVVIVEGLNLSKVSPGPYQLIALPLNLQGVDGAPTRVILVGP
jgi:arylformamidase